MARVFRKIGLVMLLAVVLSGCSLPLGKRNQGALQVTSNLAAAVHLDDQHVGQTPFFDEKLKVGEYVLKLVPSGGSDENVWQSKISIGERVLSVVNYEFGREPDQSSYEVLELEPMSSKTATELVISTLPDNAIVKLDGDLKGFSPISFDDVSAGDHTISLEAPGYKQKTINAKVNEGHRLKITVQLAKDTLVPDKQATDSGVIEDKSDEGEPKPTVSPSPSPKPDASATPTPSPKASASPTPKPVDGVISGAVSVDDITAPYVKILDTGTGWLRVRSEPTGQADNEVAKVKVGTYFKYVEKNQIGWTKIEYETGSEGWVATKYVQLTE